MYEPEDAAQDFYVGLLTFMRKNQHAGYTAEQVAAFGRKAGMFHMKHQRAKELRRTHTLLCGSCQRTNEPLVNARRRVCSYCDSEGLSWLARQHIPTNLANEPDSTLDTLAAPTIFPTEQMVYDEFTEGLSPVQRQVFALLGVVDRGYGCDYLQEIANRMGISRRMVAYHVAALKKHFQALHPDMTIRT